MEVGGLDSSDLRQRQVQISCEYSNEPSGSVNGGEFLDQLSNCYLLKKDSVPWS